MDSPESPQSEEGQNFRCRYDTGGKKILGAVPKLGWHPRIGVEEGLLRTYTDYLAALAA